MSSRIQSEQSDRTYFSPSLVHYNCIPGIRRTTWIRNILWDQASTTSQEVTGPWSTKTGAVVLLSPSPIVQALLYPAVFSDVPWQLQHVSRALGTDWWDTNSPRALSLAQSCPLPWRPDLTRERSRTHSISKTNPHFKARSVFASEGKQLNSRTAAFIHETTLFIQINFL